MVLELSIFQAIMKRLWAEWGTGTPEAAPARAVTEAA
jgi:hypothetical protein